VSISAEVPWPDVNDAVIEEHELPDDRAQGGYDEVGLSVPQFEQVFVDSLSDEGKSMRHYEVFDSQQWTEIRELFGEREAKDIGYPATLKPIGHGGDNWVTRSGGLPLLIRRVANHLLEQGKTESTAIATAVNWAKKMCATGTAFGGKVKVGAKAQAAACKAVAEWEKKKAASHAKKAMPWDEHDWEIKARHVRTAAGAKKYGKPIGSVIIGGAGGHVELSHLKETP
jgi:hypothetical protein